MNTSMKKISLLAGTVALVLSLTACDSSDQMDGAKKEKEILYWVAPMDANYRKDGPGKSPMGMDLVPFYKEEKAEKKEKKILYWVAPMDANFRQDGPGKSPMGMDLVPFYEEGDGNEDGAVTISPAIVQNLGVRTEKATLGKLWKRIDSVGYVDFDENLISHVHLRTEGWIEKLAVKSEGERVKKGDLLFELYSPTLVNAQDEYIQALRSNNKRLINASFERLQALGVDRSQINRVKKIRQAEQLIKVRASQDGIVSKLNAREGMFVKPRMEVMTLADLSSIWIVAEVFERQAGWVKVGKPAEVTLSYLPGRKWEGKVEYVYPSLDPKTRTLRARLRFDNADEALKPNMFANVVIYGGATDDMVSIPLEALIRTGNSERVIISLGDGKFIPREVVSGIESGDRIQIMKGLDGNETIVTSSQFLLDSEASISASFSRMTEVVPKNDMAMQENASLEKSKKVTGKGVVGDAMTDGGKINLSHEPISELGWPAMTMDFKLAEGVSTKALKPGMTVEFELMEKNDVYLIESIKPAMPMEKESEQ